MQTTHPVKNVMLPVVMLSLALGIRQMSMTVVMPFISTYCKTLSGYTSFFAGLALGMFGLTQAVFQIPFGIMSDKFGNKRLILIGLAMVIVGLFTASFAKNIWVLIFARGLQGSGAIIGVAYSWANSMVDKSRRLDAMSILGAFISVAAALAFALGPLLRGIMPVSDMFLVCALLLLCNGVYILFFMKEGSTPKSPQIITKLQFGLLMKNKTYVVMNLAAFLNNLLMVSVFYGLPLYLDKVTGQSGMWKIFVPAIAAAILLMKAAVAYTAKGNGNLVLILGFLLSAASILFYFQKSSFVFLLIGTILYLGGYITLATLIATRVNNIVGDSYRGTANGIFNSFQYIGNFLGSLITAAVWSVSDHSAWIVLFILGIAGCLMIGLSRPDNLQIGSEETEKA